MRRGTELSSTDRINMEFLPGLTKEINLLLYQEQWLLSDTSVFQLDVVILSACNAVKPHSEVSHRFSSTNEVFNE